MMPADDPRSPAAPEGPQQVAAPIYDRKESLWYIGPWSLVAAVVGFLLYGLFSHVNLILILPGATPDVVLPALLIPMLLGVIFGPWVGLIVGGFGFLLGDYLANTWLHDVSGNTGYLYYALTLANRDLLGWNGIPGYLASAFIGLVAGLTRINTRRYTSFNALATVGTACALAIAVATAIVVYSAVRIYDTPYYTFKEATAAFLDTVLPNVIIALVILPFLLFLYDLLALHRKNIRH